MFDADLPDDIDDSALHVVEPLAARGWRSCHFLTPWPSLATHHESGWRQPIIPHQHIPNTTIFRNAAVDRKLNLLLASLASCNLLEN